MTEITNFTQGNSVNILAIDGRDDLTHRMEAMGIYPGKTVEIVKVLGMAIILQVGHSRVAIRTSSHLKIWAEETLSPQRNTSLNYATA